MKSHNERSSIPLSLFSIFLFISISIVIFGYIYYVNQINAIKASKHADLAAIGALKVDQICQWRKEHIRYAGYIKDNTLNADTLSNFIKNYHNISMNHNIHSWMASFSKNFDFYNIFLLDSIGNPLLSVDLSFP